ncbi:MAG: SoxW family protein [Wolinella sp.]
MNFRLFILALSLFLLLGCDNADGVSSSVISQGAKMSATELEKIDNLDKASYAELADLFLDNKTIDPGGRFLLIIFGANGCIYCDKLKAEIKESPELKNLIKDNFSPYYVNGSYSKPHKLITAKHTAEMMTGELVQLYGVRPTPTIIFATPEGKTVLSYPGYMPKERFLATLKFVINHGYDGAQDEKEIMKRLGAIYKERNL